MNEDVKQAEDRLYTAAEKATHGKAGTPDDLYLDCVRMAQGLHDHTGIPYVTALTIITSNLERI